MQRVVPPTPQSLRCIGGVAAYGLAIDPGGSVWVAAPSGDRPSRLRRDRDGAGVELALDLDVPEGRLPLHQRSPS